ncbi:uncharacterized protein LOC123502505 [Portunus trituberculatus]|uniref:uncharacterized protein LOC123502505 n=1 Tax=Portunus trituberculatus TaxID=210409 RepID=UPI001E1CFB9C|nr:uncharacterized protein LOC123502505 [Portunus trituberculatus]
MGDVKQNEVDVAEAVGGQFTAQVTHTLHHADCPPLFTKFGQACISVFCPGYRSKSAIVAELQTTPARKSNNNLAVSQSVSSPTVLAVASRTSAYVTASMIAAVTERMSLCSCVGLRSAGRRISGVCEPVYINTRESYYCQCRPCSVQTRVRKFKYEDIDECVESPRSSPCGPSPQQYSIRPAAVTVMRRRSLKCQLPKLAPWWVLCWAPLGFFA